MMDYEYDENISDFRPNASYLSLSLSPLSQRNVDNNTDEDTSEQLTRVHYSSSLKGRFTAHLLRNKYEECEYLTGKLYIFVIIFMTINYNKLQ